MIDPVALRSLSELARSGSIAAVAAELDFTPSAVSQQIKRLERDLGVALVARAGRGVALTTEGNALAGAAPAVFHALERARLSACADAPAPGGPLRVAAHSTAIRGLLAPRLPQLRREAADLDLYVVELEPADCVVAVARGRVDVAIVHDWVGVPTHLPPELNVVDVATDVADVLVHRDDPLAQLDTLNPEHLLHRDWVGNPPGSICHAWFLHMFAGHPHPPRVVAHLPEYDTQIAYVRAGGVVALMPRLGRQHLAPQVCAVPLVDPVPRRTIKATWRRSSDASVVVRYLIDLLTQPPIS